MSPFPTPQQTGADTLGANFLADINDHFADASQHQASQTSLSDYDALKAISVSGLSANETRQVLGYNDPGDGGAGLFRYDPASTTAEDKGTVLAPNVGTGRWIRVY